MSLNPTEFERKTAITVHATIAKDIRHEFPLLTIEDRDALFVGILDRVARMRGWVIKREYVHDEEDDD